MDEDIILSKDQYVELIEMLFASTQLFTVSNYAESNRSDVINLASLIRATLEASVSSFELVKNDRFFAASTVLRSAMEHVLLLNLLYKSPMGETMSFYKFKRTMHEFLVKASKGSSFTNLDILKSKVDFKEVNEFRFTKDATEVLSKFEKHESLNLFYFVFSQTVHPLGVFSLYSELGSSGAEVKIRTTSNLVDSLTFLPHIFRFSCNALLIDAELRGDLQSIKLLEKLALIDGFNPRLRLQSNLK